MPDRGPRSRAFFRAIVIQVLIAAGLVFWLKFYLPRVQRAKEAALAAERERKIAQFFSSSVEDDPSRLVPMPNAPAGSGQTTHPQKLRRAYSVDDVEQALGAPNVSTSDFQQDQHLTWLGVEHKLVASFARGRLYALRLEDQHTGHGSMVFESSLYWQQF